MNINVNEAKLCLNDELCEKFKEKVLYDVTESECKMYAEAFFEKSFDEILELYSVEDIVNAIEKAMQEEIDL